MSERVPAFEGVVYCTTDEVHTMTLGLRMGTGIEAPTPSWLVSQSLQERLILPNSEGVAGYAKRFRTKVAAATLVTLLCSGLGPSFPPVTHAQTFSDAGFSSEVVATLPQFLPVGVTWANDGRMFIWQRNGVIRI